MDRFADERLECLLQIADVLKHSIARARTEGVIDQAVELRLRKYTGRLCRILADLRDRQGTVTAETAKPTREPAKRDGWPILLTWRLPTDEDFSRFGARSGDVAVGELLCTYPLTSIIPTRQAKAGDIIGRWLVIYTKDGEALTYDDVLVGRVGNSYIVDQDGTRFDRSRIAAVYQIVEVRPGADREWRDDPDFLAAVRMLKA